jgi:preprotein translocase subunit SecA
MDDLRESIALRVYGQKDPLIEYKKEGYEMFATMVDEIKRNIVTSLFRISTVPPDITRTMGVQEDDLEYFDATTETTSTGFVMPQETQAQPQQPQRPVVSPIVRTQRKVGRNEPCPCGSGKKYKKCCGANVQ